MNKKIQNPVQVRFFERLKKNIDPGISLPDVLSTLFGITIDGAYRRMRGDTAVTMDEMFKICKHFKIPIEVLTGSDKNHVTFTYESFGEKSLDIDAYLKSIIANLEALKRLPDIHIVFAAENVPGCHYFEFDETPALKFFYW